MNLLKNTIFINLETRPDRLAHATAELAKIGVVGERFNAIRTKSGAVGCTLSHIKCLEIAKERGYDHVFICEDDITFNNPALLLANLAKFADNEEIMWDMCLVGANNVPPFQPITDYCIRVFYAQTTTGYIVKNHYYDTLIENFKQSAQKLIQKPGSVKENAIDIYWKRLQKQDYWYMIIPATVTQYANHSDIENRVTDYDRLMLDIEKPYLVGRR
jgi:glycosyl transferase family 25